MKKVLGLIGSHRKLGNCELITKEIFLKMGELLKSQTPSTKLQTNSNLQAPKKFQSPISEHQKNSNSPAYAEATADRQSPITNLQNTQHSNIPIFHHSNALHQLPITNYQLSSENEKDFELSLIRLPPLKILPCKACYACLKPQIECKLDDDMSFILDSIKESDYIIISAPCYLLGPSGIMKMITDREFMSVRYRNEFAKKRTIIAALAGIKAMEGYTIPALNLFARSFGLNLIDSYLFEGASPGEVLLDKKNYEIAGKLARALVDENYVRQSAENECPNCWNTIFRFNPLSPPFKKGEIKEGFKLECIFCRTEGEVKKTDGGEIKFQFKIREMEDVFKGKGAAEHFQWLIDKKKDFEKEKENLNKIREQYKDIGKWSKS